MFVYHTLVEELNPVSAVTAHDPYPFYAHLTANRPWYFDPRIAMWVAAGANAVEAILANPLMRVRPPHEPVPAAIAGTPLGETFSLLMRMTDGARQTDIKRVAEYALHGADRTAVATTAERIATELLARLSAHDAQHVEQYAFTLPVRVVASLLGFDTSRQAAIGTWTQQLARALAPTSSAADIKSGCVAVQALAQAIRATPAHDSLSLRARFDAEADRCGFDTETVTANTIGLLLQTYEATAGLIGNTLVALARSGKTRTADAVSNVSLLTRFVAEVARYDPPIQTTRRYAASATTIFGCNVQTGEGILLILAAANRDATANVAPDSFDVDREYRTTYSFGMGVHACPGNTIAATIATIGVSHLLRGGFDPAKFGRIHYRPSVNARIPQLAKSVRVTS